LLTACGSSNSGSRNDFGSDNRGENIDENADVRRVGVVVEATQQMLNTSRRPGEASIIEADISCNAISVVQLFPDSDAPSFFTAGVANGLPNFNVTTRVSPIKLSAGDGCQIEFDEEYNPRVDTAIQVEFPNEEFLYAPLRIVNSENESIYVSFGSQLTLENFYSKINSQDDLDEALPCSSSNLDCETQYRAKTRLLSFMAETSRLYEYVDLINSSDNSEVALEKLRQQPDLSQHVNIATNEILRETSPIAKGTVRDDYNIIDNPDLADGILQSRLQPSEIFNSVFFSMNLSDELPSETSTNKTAISTSSSRLSDGDSNNSQSYPRLIHNAYFLDYRYDDILPSIPYESSKYIFNEAAALDTRTPENRYAYLSNDFREDNDGNQQSPTNGTHLNSEGFFLNDRALNQTITEVPNANGETGIGFDYNPVYYKLFRVNDYEPDTSLTNFEAETPDYGDSPTWITGAGYGIANIYAINQVNDAPLEYERTKIEEIRHMFAYELHGIETTSNIGDNDLAGNNYNAMEFSITFDSNNSGNPITVRAETLEWRATNNGFSQSQNNAHSQTRELKRARDDSIVKSDTDFKRTLSNSRRYSFVNSEAGERNGLMQLDSGQTQDKPLGHVSPNGHHLAFALQNSTNSTASRGILIANKTTTTAPSFSNGESYTYLISGNYVAMDAQFNTMGNVNGSQLIITGVANSNAEDCSAVLEVNTLSLNHDIANKNIEDASTTAYAPILSTSCTINRDEIELTFTLDGNPLILRGFATAEDNDSPYPSKLINLLWLQDQQVGLVFAQLDQNLSPTFE
jgi:hypothetical protein